MCQMGGKVVDLPLPAFFFFKYAFLFLYFYQTNISPKMISFKKNGDQRQIKNKLE